ncbi:MAG: SUMF1/EgtB/PvdO family nonheme iron enzyme, partial [Planctomycetes bacterium]|nr:SUMF1/EgtB/PvdO family nonheme iron enzyme [Planctomycetota bacterium]
GVFNLSGNVAEWARDWYAPDYYASAPAVDPFNGTSTGTHVLRGGGFDDSDNVGRASYRFTSNGTSRLYYAGFRCVRRGE